MRVAYSPNYTYRLGKSSSSPLRDLNQFNGPLSPYLPAPALAEDLRALHSPDYVDSILSGNGPLARVVHGSWSEKYRDACLSMNGGMLLAAELAVSYGVSANLAHGFLHARPNGGADGCTFNGIALVAQKYPDKKVVVLNCNHEPGVALAEFAEKLPNLYHVALSGKNAHCPQHERSRLLKYDAKEPDNVALWKDFCWKGLCLATDCKPDLVVYLAGVDGWDTMVSKELLKERDNEIILSLAEQAIPCVVLPGGGGTGLRRDQIRLAKQTLHFASDILRQIRKHQMFRFFLSHHTGTMVLIDDPSTEYHGFWATGMTPAELEAWWLDQATFEEGITPCELIFFEIGDEKMDLTKPVFRGPLPGVVIDASVEILWNYWEDQRNFDQWRKAGWYRGYVFCDSEAFLQRPDGSYVGSRRGGQSTS